MQFESRIKRKIFLVMIDTSQFIKIDIDRFFFYLFPFIDDVINHSPKPFSSFKIFQQLGVF